MDPAHSCKFDCYAREEGVAIQYFQIAPSNSHLRSNSILTMVSHEHILCWLNVDNNKIYLKCTSHD